MNLGEIPYSLNGPTSEALVAGRLHWRSSMAQDDGSNSKAIMSFDLGTQQFQPVPGSEFLSGGNSSNLANLRGCLSAAVLNGDGSTDMGYEELQHQGIMEQGAGHSKPRPSDLQVRYGSSNYKEEEWYSWEIVQSFIHVQGWEGLVSLQEQMPCYLRSW
ncbi:hypothetical protein LINPERPRIM_LOCUS7202 [Linum perenne]